MLTRSMESSDLAPACPGLAGWGVGLNKGIVVPTSTSILERAVLNPVPPVLVLKLVSFVPPHVSLALSELLPLCWSPEQVEFVSLFGGCRSKTALHITRS